MGAGGTILGSVEVLVFRDVAAHLVGGLDQVVAQVGVASFAEAAVFGGHGAGLGAGPPQAGEAGHGGLGREAVEGPQFGHQAGDQLLAAAFDLREAWSKRVPTAALNRWFDDALAANPPPDEAWLRAFLDRMLDALALLHRLARRAA